MHKLDDAAQRMRAAGERVVQTLQTTGTLSGVRVSYEEQQRNLAESSSSIVKPTEQEGDEYDETDYLDDDLEQTAENLRRALAESGLGAESDMEEDPAVAVVEADRASEEIIHDERKRNRKLIDDLQNFKAQIHSQKVITPYSRQTIDRLPTSSRKSLELHNLMNSYQISRSAKEDIVRWFNGYLEENQRNDLQLLSTYRSQRLQSDVLVPSIAMSYDMCISGCKLYTENDTTNMCCYSNCNKARYTENSTGRSPNLTPAAICTYFPLTEQLAYFLQKQKNRDAVEAYAAQRDEEKDTEDISDFFSGELYKSHFKRTTTSRYIPLFLSLYVDGFTPFRKGALNMTMIMATLTSLPPNIR